MGLTTLEVDGLVYKLDYHGHDRPLAARLGEDLALELQPWRLGQHLVALDQALAVDRGGLALDDAAYAAQVLAGAGEVTRWGPLALWWAAGAANEGPPQGYALRPWTLLERASAVRAARDPETGGFHVGRYLSMLVACCVARAGGGEPLALPMCQGGPLLAAACRLCAPEPLLPAVMDDPALRALTMRVCTALGWSPSRVWQTPAGEIDQVLALLDRTPASRPRPKLSALADLPDTHTIHFEDE